MKELLLMGMPEVISTPTVDCDFQDWYLGDCVVVERRRKITLEGLRFHLWWEVSNPQGEWYGYSPHL